MVQGKCPKEKKGVSGSPSVCDMAEKLSVDVWSEIEFSSVLDLWWVGNWKTRH